MHHTPTYRSPLLPALVLALLAPLAGCSDDEPQGSDTAAEATPAQASGSPSEGAAEEGDESGLISTRMNGWEVSVRYDATDRYRQDHFLESRIHLLPYQVVSDPTAERWADIAVWSPTRSYAPGSGKRGPMPADPVGWLRDHPGVEVLREQRVDLGDAGGHRGWQLDVERDGSELFGDRDGGFEGDGLERMVLWQVEDTWFLAHAGTFQGRRGLLRDDAPDDVLKQVLAGAEYARP